VSPLLHRNEGSGGVAGMKGFKEFLMRGNVVDLAVAVVIGAAFGAVVTAFATDFIGSLIAAIGGVPSVGDVGPTVNGTKIVLGTTLTALLNFVIVAAVVYFVVVVPMKKLMERRQAGADAETPAPTDEAVLLTQIRDLLQAQQQGGIR
jgi:large conductance mechanosensitive channel